jgi:hypothetical protein
VACQAWNPGQALDTGQLFRNRPLDQVIPCLAGGYRHGNGLEAAGTGAVRAATFADHDALGGDVDDGTGEAIIRDDEVTAPAEDKEGIPGLVGHPDQREEFVVAGSLDEPAGGAS